MPRSAALGGSRRQGSEREDAPSPQVRLRALSGEDRAPGSCRLQLSQWTSKAVPESWRRAGQIRWAYPRVELLPQSTPGLRVSDPAAGPEVVLPLGGTAPRGHRDPRGQLWGPQDALCMHRPRLDPDSPVGCGAEDALASSYSRAFRGGLPAPQERDGRGGGTPCSGRRKLASCRRRTSQPRKPVHTAHNRPDSRLCPHVLLLPPAR